MKIFLPKYIKMIPKKITPCRENCAGPGTPVRRQLILFGKMCVQRGEARNIAYINIGFKVSFITTNAWLDV